LILQDFETKLLTISQPGLVKVKGIVLEHKKLIPDFDKVKGFRLSRYLELKESCKLALVVHIV
jgi:hypothetical protein